MMPGHGTPQVPTLAPPGVRRLLAICAVSLDP
jgi:hypothetical protein